MVRNTAILSVLTIGLALPVGSLVRAVRAESLPARVLSKPATTNQEAIQQLREQVRRAEVDLREAKRRLDQMQHHHAIRRLPPVEPASVFVGQASTTSLASFEGGESPSQPPGCVQESDCWCNVVQKDPDTGGLLLPWSGVALKVGGFVKGDFIHDFNAIGSTDKFQPGTIFTDGRPGENTRLTARQTRLNLDIRRPTPCGKLRTFVEVDFFGDGSTLRLRHAYGEVGGFLAGQTWSTFIDPDIIPKLLDNESTQSGVFLTRPAMIRWTQPVFVEGLVVAVAVEDPAPTSTVFPPPGIDGRVEAPLPDFVARIKYKNDWGHVQSAGFVGVSGFQPTSGSADDVTVWGFNFTGRLDLTGVDSLMSEVAFGDGLSRFDDVTAVGPDLDGSLIACKAFTWAIAWEHNWSERWSSTFAYSRPRRSVAPGEPSDAIRATQYLATNLIWQPSERILAGVEYLYGTRTNKDGAFGLANRLMFSVRYTLL